VFASTPVRAASMPSDRISARIVLALALASVVACARERLPTEPLVPDAVPNLGSRTVTLAPGSTAAEYMVVVANTLMNGTSSAAFTIQGSGLAPVTTRLSATELPGALDAAAAAAQAGDGLPDIAGEARRRMRERAVLAPMIGDAQRWFATRPVPSGTAAPAAASRQAIPADARVGDVVRVNVNGDSVCSAPTYHGARIVAMGTRAMILEDTLNPRNGFTATDYARFAAKFDTLVFPLDSAAFGAPTDIDHNGHVAIIFTRAVNEMTPPGSGSYVGGFAFSRDLFPVVATARTRACAGSNEGEFFYLLAPDPSGSINGNPRTTVFVDSVTIPVIAHEFQHLINFGRRLYVNDASAFEEQWLDEALAHMAEELLFYRESGLTARANIDLAALRTSTRTLYGFNRDMNGNQGRYRSYLFAPSRNSPFGVDDGLATRGSAWSLLRYLTDHAASSDGDLLFRLVNSQLTGVSNLVAVFGAGVSVQARDWNVSNAADDLTTTAAWLQPSWNWHSIYPAIGSSGQYPLAYQPMASGVAYSGTVLGGGAAYYKVAVAANGSATLTFTETAGVSPMLSLVTVRIQ
jgi:hypothetical protein